jgi:hypothetical protein
MSFGIMGDKALASIEVIANPIRIMATWRFE